MDSIFAFLAGLFGLSRAGSGSKPAVLPTPTTAAANVRLKSAAESIPGTASACYNPEPDVTIELRYDPNGNDNFHNLSDIRPTLNPTLFPKIVTNYQAKFNTDFTNYSPSDPNADKSCVGKLMYNYSGNMVNPRTYIRVRENLRISSCKTDELAGPYNLINSLSPTPAQVCTRGQEISAGRMRGTCSVVGYPDLRKVAETTDKTGNKLDIFWTPFTHNVGCSFDNSNPNCGVGDGTNMNSKEFLYVLKARQAFDPENLDECYVYWNESTGHANPCSHYFDVYMAKDLYEKMLTMPTGPYKPLPTNNPEYKFNQNYWLFFEKMKNCKEQTVETPVTCSPVDFPPCFIEKPFMATNFSKATDTQVKIDLSTEENYCRFVVNKGASNSHLYTLESFTEEQLNWKSKQCSGLPTVPVTSADTCPSNIWNPGPDEDVDNDGIYDDYPSCFSKIGEINLKDSEQADVLFEVYGSWERPTNFFLKARNSTKYPKIYEYITVSTLPPSNSAKAPSLQLTNLKYMAGVQWTWATPVCKPAIYLYPGTTKTLNVRLDIDGKITVSDPVYDSKSGWNVVADPDGKLTLPETGFKLPNDYLYYEADVNGIDIPDEGYVVERSKVSLKIQEIMKKMGFSTAEISDFLSYWQPRLTGKPYYFITLLPESEVNQKEKLMISENPDTLIRARFVFEGLDLPILVKPLDIGENIRNGFTVTDWGGTLIGSSCENVSVK